MSGALLTFEPIAHEYRRADGELVPSVTQILSATRISTDFEALKAISPDVDRAIEHRRAIGTALHSDICALDDDDLNLEQVHREVLPYVLAWGTFRQNLDLFPLTRERIVYSPTLGVCGRLDGIFIRHHDRERRILIDVKIGDPESAAAQFQTALYQILWDGEHPDQLVDERWAVQLCPDLTIPYRVTKYTDWTDFATARAIVATFHVQAASRQPRRT